MVEYDILRFVRAHESGCFMPCSDYQSALAEIKAGRKRNHWIWYIFPQLQGLGRSDMCREYGVHGLGEAKALMANQTFASHLREISRALLDLDGSDPVEAVVRLHRTAIEGNDPRSHELWPILNEMNTTTGHYFRGAE